MNIKTFAKRSPSSAIHLELAVTANKRDRISAEIILIVDTVGRDAAGPANSTHARCHAGVRPVLCLSVAERRSIVCHTTTSQFTARLQHSCRTGNCRKLRVYF